MCTHTRLPPRGPGLDVHDPSQQTYQDRRLAQILGFTVAESDAMTGVGLMVGIMVGIMVGRRHCGIVGRTIVLMAGGTHAVDECGSGYSGRSGG